MKLRDVAALSLTGVLLLSWDPVPAQVPADQAGSGTVTAVQDGVVFLGSVPHKIVSVNTDDGTVDVAVPFAGITPIVKGERLLFSGRPIPFGGKSLLDTRQGYVYREQERDFGQAITDFQTQIQSQVGTALGGASPSVADQTGSSGLPVDQSGSDFDKVLEAMQKQVESKFEDARNRSLTPGVTDRTPPNVSQTSDARRRDGSRPGAESPSDVGEPNAVPIMVMESQQQRRDREDREATETQARRVDLLLAIASILLAIVALERIPKVFFLAVSGLSLIRRKTGSFIRKRRSLLGRAKR